MFLKLIYLFVIFLSVQANAKTLYIEYGFNIFSFEVKENEIKYQKKSYTDSVTKRKCSENLFKNFANRIINLTKNFPKSDKDNGDFMVKYRFENKTGQLNPSTSYAKKLLSLSLDFDSFKLATEFRCEGEKE